MPARQSVSQRVGLLVALSVIGGLLIAGLALPVVGGFGYAANATNRALQNLPSALDEVPLAQHSVLLAADGTTLATLAGAEDRVSVTLGMVPIGLQQSIVAIEDNRFYEHQGVDVRGLLRAISKDTGSGDFSQGASTITQQYVKQMLVELATNSSATDEEKKEAQKAATEKSIARKAREARYAIALEKKLSKAEILERYLNIAYFGQGVYGVATAAQHYFGVTVDKLTLAQSALLAGLVNSPAAFDPNAHPKAAQERRDLVLDADAKYGFIPQAEVDAAKKEPVVVQTVQKQADPCATSVAPFYCAYVLDKLLKDPALGKTKDDIANTVYEGGLVIQTTFDPRVQAAVDAGIKGNLANNINQGMGVAVIEPGTGNILAIGENRDYGSGPGQSKTVFPAQASYDTGSTFKAVTLTAAIAAGVPIDTTYDSPYCYVDPTNDYAKDKTANKKCPGGSTNDDPSQGGSYNMVTGTWQSVNNYFIQLETKGVSTTAVQQMAINLGDNAPNIKNRANVGDSLTLGTAGGTSVIDMANIYATLAARGKECDPRTITAIRTLAGSPVEFTRPAACRQAVSPDVADKVTGILQGVLTDGTAAGKGIGRPAAGKTGTLDDFNGAWFVGYVPQYATAVGIFNPQSPASTILPIKSLKTGTNFTARIFGGDIPTDTWQMIMRAAVDGLPVQNFVAPKVEDPQPTPTPTVTAPATSTAPPTAPTTSTVATPTGSAAPPPPTLTPPAAGH